MAWIWTSILAFLFLLHLLLKPWKPNAPKIKKPPLPPGPKGWPILGSLHLLGKLPHRDLQSLAKQYGPIMHLRLGLVPTVVVSSPEAAELILKTHDNVFASRPPHQAAKHLLYGQSDMAFAAYTPFWRDLRKLCAVELLGRGKIESFKDMRREEVCSLMESVRVSARDGWAVNLSKGLWSMSFDMSCRMLFGTKMGDDRAFVEVALEGMYLLAVPNLADFFPALVWFDRFRGLTKRMKNVSRLFDEFMEEIIDRHVHCRDEERSKDIVDVMLGLLGSDKSEYLMERTNIKAILLDLLLASIDATSTTIEWVLSELIKNPHIMKKVQNELDNVAGKQRMVEESDLESLEYFNMVIKETLRLHPAGPLLLPHAAMEEITINGYHVPKGSRVIVNVWAIGRDPDVWNNAEKFLPERFSGIDVDVHGHDFKLIPFGSGRRICPGMQLGLTVIRLVVAQLVHCFDWKLPNDMSPDELDMTEDFGIAIPRVKHLLAIPICRLHI